MKKSFPSDSLGTRLRILRGLSSQTKTAKVFGIAQQTYAGWETDKRKPSITELSGIAVHFGVSCDWLLGLTDDPHPRHSPGSIHINGESNSVINGHGINATVTNGNKTEAKTVLERLDALEAAVKMLSTRIS